MIDFVVLAGAHALAASAATHWSQRLDEDVAIWPAAGVALTGLMLAGVRMWPAVLVGGAVAALLVFPIERWWLELPWAGIDTLAAVGAVVLLRRMGVHDRPTRTRDMVALLTVGALLVPAVATGVGTAVVEALGTTPPRGPGWTWLGRWLAHATGVITVAPLALVWATAPSRPVSASQAAHLAGCLLAGGIMAALVFGPLAPAFLEHWPLLAVMGVLVWAALGLHARGATAVLAVIAALAAWGTASGHGPFGWMVEQPDWLHYVSLQQFLLAGGTTCLLLAVANDRRPHEDALQASQARLRDIERRLEIALEASGTGLWTWDPRSDTGTWFPESFSLTGRTRSEAGGVCTDMLRFIHPDDRERVWAAMREAVVNGATYQCEFRVMRADGGITWAESRGRARCDADGQPLELLGTIADVTQRRQSEQALRQSEDRLRRSLLAARMDAYEVDIASDHVQRAIGKEVLFGDEADAFGTTGSEYLRLVSQDDRSALDATIRALSPSSPAAELEYRVISPSGRTFWLRDAFSGEFDEAGRLVRLRGVTVDISPRRRAEEERNRAQALTRSIIDASAALIFAKDMQGRLFLLNRAWCETVGRTAEEASGLTDAQIFDEDTARMLRANDERVLFGGESLTFEEAIVVRGEPRMFLTNKFPLADDNGSIYAVCGVAADITELKRTQAALAAREHALATLADNSPAILARFDRQLRHVFVSAALERLTGRARGDIVGRTLREIGLPMPLCGHYEHALRDVLDSGRAGTLEYELDTLDGPRHYASQLVPELDAHGSVEHVLSVAVDVTDRKRAEQAQVAANRALATARDTAEATAVELEARVRSRTRELEAARAAAEAASRAKSEFLAHISHEIRTPLTGVLASADLVLGEPLAPHQRVRLEVLRSSALALRELLDDVLDFARIEAGRLDPQTAVFSPRDLLEDAAALFSGAATGKGLLLATQARALPARCVGDPRRLRQVLLNLIGNAVKFTKHGRVDVRATWLPRTGGLRFTVRDTGIGLSRGAHERLFSPFEQADEVRSGGFGGSGLGLAISRRLVAAMGGTLRARGAPGRGAVFIMRVPVQPAEQEAHASPQLSVASTPLPATQRPLRLLLVEDHALNRGLIAAMLASLGHDVGTASDGLEALRAAEHGDYDAVLMDIRMAGMDGVEAARLIRRLPGRRGRVPILAVSADALELQRLAADGVFDAFIAKPIDWAALDEALVGVREGASTARTEAGTTAERGVDDPAREPPLVDTAKLGPMMLRLGEARTRAFIERLSTDLEEAGRALRAALLAGEAAQARERAHALAGLAGMFGCMALARMAKSIQQEPAAARIESLDALLARTVGAVAAHLATTVPERRR